MIAAPAILYFMRLAADERRTVVAVGAASALLLPVGLLALAVARRFSVPSSLLDMTGRGWECMSVREAAASDETAA